MDKYASMKRETGKLKVTRKQFMLGGAALAGTALFSRFTGKKQAGELSVVASSWYEVVQDAERPSLWHLNLFSGIVRGDLSRATLVDRRTMTSMNVDSIKKDMEFPWRIQKLDGHQEQSF